MISDATRRLWSRQRKGRAPWNKGKKCKQLSRENNSQWKGDDASYSAFHYRVVQERGTPMRCEVCGTTERKYYEWANLTGDYANVYDYKRMCVPCHRKFDKERRKA